MKEAIQTLFPNQETELHTAERLLIEAITEQEDEEPIDELIGLVKSDADYWGAKMNSQLRVLTVAFVEDEVTHSVFEWIKYCSIELTGDGEDVQTEYEPFSEHFEQINQNLSEVEPLARRVVEWFHTQSIELLVGVLTSEKNESGILRGAGFTRKEVDYFICRYIDELSISEIENQLDMSERTVSEIQEEVEKKSVAFIAGILFVVEKMSE